MNLSKLSKVFSGSSTADAILVVGHATAAVNGVYTTADNGTTYTNGTYTIKTASSVWGIYNGSTKVTEEAAATSRPQGGVWADCNVLEAVSLTVASGTVVVALSLMMSGGVAGGAMAQYADGIAQVYSAGASETICVDARQVFTAGGIYFGGSDGVAMRLSYDVVTTA